MMTYQEWVKIVEGSEAMRNVGKRFGLDDAMLRKGIEALMPAAFMGAFPSAPSFNASIPNPFQQVFESDEAKKAVARQAEMLSGINKTILEDMMPAIATAMADAMQKFSSGENAATGCRTGPGRSDHQRAPRRCLLGRRPQAGSPIPVAPRTDPEPGSRRRRQAGAKTA